MIKKEFQAKWYPIKNQCLHHCEWRKRELHHLHKDCIKCQLLKSREILLSKFPDMCFENCNCTIMSSDISKENAKEILNQVFTKLQSLPFVYAEDLLFTNEYYFDFDTFENISIYDWDRCNMCLLDLKGNINKNNDGIKIKYYLRYRITLNLHCHVFLKVYINFYITDSNKLRNYSVTAIFEPIESKLFQTMSSTKTENVSLPIQNNTYIAILNDLEKSDYYNLLFCQNKRIKEKKRIYDGRSFKTLILDDDKYTNIEEENQMSSKWSHYTDKQLKNLSGPVHVYGWADPKYKKLYEDAKKDGMNLLAEKLYKLYYVGVEERNND